MNDFNDIKSQWAQRSIPETPVNGYKNVIKNAKYVSRKQQLGQTVLIATVIVLLGFFYYVSAFKNTRLTSGLILMIGSLLLRIGTEFFSNAKLKTLTPIVQVDEFSKKIVAYYKSRLLIHAVLTPILFITYSIGFVILLPSFKANLSAGFYNYIIVSAVVSLVFLSILIAVQIRKELKLIKQMSAHTADAE